MSRRGNSCLRCGPEGRHDVARAFQGRAGKPLDVFLLTLLAAAVLLPCAAAAQEPRITSSPRIVTTQDPLFLTLTGTSTCGASHPEPPRIDGDRIVLQVFGNHSCSPPLPLPFTRDFSLGRLPAGTWAVEGWVDDELVTTRVLNVDPVDRFLPLHDGSFEVHVDWRTPDGALSGKGSGVPLSKDSGYIFFFDGANPEISVKILDGGPVNGFWWVFISTTTNLELTITVRNIEVFPFPAPPFISEKIYVSPAGANLNFIDTEAFP